jgi:hypothetical protein
MRRAQSIAGLESAAPALLWESLRDGLIASQVQRFVRLRCATKASTTGRAC